MRCPKCGYISFDHLETCLKCNKDMSGASVETEGTTFNVEAPIFLKIQTDNTSYDTVELDEEFSDLGDDLVDPDLDILIDDDDSEENIEFDGGLEGEEDFSIALEDDIGEELTEKEESTGIDLGQFGEFESDAPAPDEEVEIRLPDELADISDLSAPEIAGGEDVSASSETDVEDKLSGDGFEVKLDLGETDSDFSLSSTEEKQKDSLSGDLSLDDIGLSGKETVEEPPAPKTNVVDEMDSDLDFELDLGDILSPKK